MLEILEGEKDLESSFFMLQNDGGGVKNIILY